MEDMDDLYIKLQVYLMKKDTECGQLRFLTSRTTIENSEHVQNICDTVADILRNCHIPINEDTSVTNPRCVQAFKYLVLNTNFESQEMLAEDPANGHLVDMCPPLSPYLLIEILWSLRFEKIVAESILHVPLDLAVEIIEISRRCINLMDFPRGLHFLSEATLNCYKKLRRIDKVGAITTRIDESLDRLMIYCQELIALFCDPTFTRIVDVKDLKESERHGLILKYMLLLVMECLDCSKNDVDLSSETATMYKMTFGREPYRRMNENFVTQLGMVDQEFVHILLKKLTDIDVRTYIDWASLEYLGDSTLTLQKSIGTDCYNFIEFTKSYENLIKLEKLVECLQQISSKPESKKTINALNLDELRKGAENGKRECIKELMNRHREWNHEIFNVIRENQSALDKDDFFNLLEYLTYVMTKNGQEEHKREVYATVTKVLLRQDIKDIYETILDYITKHDARNILESAHTQEIFKKFMSHNKNFKSPINLRLVLFFLVKNPRKILSILLKMSIGHPEYVNVMVTPNDLMLVSPVMNIYEKPDETLLIAALRDICIENVEWSTKKFAHLVHVILDERVTNPDTMINKVFIPCLVEKNSHSANVRSVLNCLRKILTTCTSKTLFGELIVAVAERMSRIRNDITLPKYTICQTLSLMIRVVELTIPKFENSVDIEKQMEFIDNIEKSLRPIDKHHFSRLLNTDRFIKIDIYDTIKDYERRCFLVMNRVRGNSEVMENKENREKQNFDSNRFEDDYVRHLVVKSTENEYVKFAIEMIILHWDNFHCKNEYEAYEKIVRITIEACVYCLEFPSLNSPCSFACLLKGLARLTRSITNLERVRDTGKIDRSLVDNFRALDKSICHTIFSSLYTNVLVEINNRASHEPMNERLQELVLLVDNFGNKCLDISHNEVNFERERSKEATRYKIAHDFIEEFTGLDCDDENYVSLCKIYKLLCANETND